MIKKSKTVKTQVQTSVALEGYFGKKPGKMAVLMNKSVAGLRMGEVQYVASGYARNFLLVKHKKRAPLATFVSKEMEAVLIDQQEKLKQERAVLEAAERAGFEHLVAALQGVSLKFKENTLDDKSGRLYGSVGRADILAALKEKHFDLSIDYIALAGPIKTVGSFDVPVKFPYDIETTVKVVVEGKSELLVPVSDKGELDKPARKKKNDYFNE